MGPLESIGFDVAAAEFREQIFERRLHLQRAALREQAMGWRDLDELLQRIEPRAPDVKLFRDGLVPEESYAEEVVEVGVRRRRFNKAGFYSQMRHGATLILNRFEFQSSYAQRLCDCVARYSGLQTTSNAYLSFGGDGSFGKHWDTHDVFAIQMLGRKRWQIFEPTVPWPLSHQSSDRVAETSQRPVFECVLEAGDVLYIPRGWWHRTHPFDEGSFHVSVGGYATTVYDYVLWACARELSQVAAARRAFLPQNSDESALAILMDVVREAVLDKDARREFQDQITARERVRSDFDLALFLDRRSALSSQVKVRLTSRHPLQLKSDEILVNGSRLRLDATNQAIVAALANGATLAMGELQARLRTVPIEALSNGVLALASHEILTIQDGETLPGGVPRLAPVSR